MGAQNILWAFFNALGFSMWGIIGRFSGASGPWIGMMIILSTAIPVMIFSWGKLAGTMPDTKGMQLLVIAGIVNGIAFMINSTKMADVTIPAGQFSAIVYASMVIIALLADYLLNNAAINIWQIGGAMMIVMGILVIFLNQQ